MDELYQSFVPIVKFTNLFGFFLFNIRTDRKFELSWLKIGSIVSLFLIMDYFLYLKIIHMNEYIQQGSFLAQFATIFISLLTETFILLSQIFNFINRNIFEKLISFLWKFDQEVSHAM